VRTYSTITATGAVLATLLFGFTAFARDHALLNDTWTLVPTKSHDVLKVITTESGAVTNRKLPLAPDGTMLVSVIRPDRKPIALVFQRK
jgi:hypothetical protein